jgi:hypothetical protein
VQFLIVYLYVRAVSPEIDVEHYIYSTGFVKGATVAFLSSASRGGLRVFSNLTYINDIVALLHGGD